MNIAHDQFGDARAYTVDIGDLTLCFSYTTLVGAYYRSRAGGQFFHEGVRRHNDWGPTTGRHMNLMNLRDHRVREVTPRELSKFVEDAIRDMGTKLLHEQMKAEA